MRRRGGSFLPRYGTTRTERRSLYNDVQHGIQHRGCGNPLHEGEILVIYPYSSSRKDLLSVY
jgi:hypothetical protein